MHHVQQDIGLGRVCKVSAQQPRYCGMFEMHGSRMQLTLLQKCYKCVQEQVETKPFNEDRYENEKKPFITADHSDGKYPEYWSSENSQAPSTVVSTVSFLSTLNANTSRMAGLQKAASHYSANVQERQPQAPSQEALSLTPTSPTLEATATAARPNTPPTVPTAHGTQSPTPPPLVLPTARANKPPYPSPSPAAPTHPTSLSDQKPRTTVLADGPRSKLIVHPLLLALTHQDPW